MCILWSRMRHIWIIHGNVTRMYILLYLHGIVWVYESHMSMTYEYVNEAKLIDSIVKVNCILTELCFIYQFLKEGYWGQQLQSCVCVFLTVLSFFIFFIYFDPLLLGASRLVTLSWRPNSFIITQCFSLSPLVFLILMFTLSEINIATLVFFYWC